MYFFLIGDKIMTTIMLHMHLPQHPKTLSNEYLYELFRERVYKKSNCKKKGKNPSVLILNLNDSENTYQMGVPIEQGSFMGESEVDNGLIEIGFTARLAGSFIGKKWTLYVYKKGQAFLRSEDWAFFKF